MEQQNTSRIVNNETEYYPSVRSHPDLHFYELVYGLFIPAIVVSSLLRSFLFIKVRVLNINLTYYQNLCKF